MTDTKTKIAAILSVLAMVAICVSAAPSSDAEGDYTHGDFLLDYGNGSTKWIATKPAPTISGTVSKTLLAVGITSSISGGTITVDGLGTTSTGGTSTGGSISTEGMTGVTVTCSWHIYSWNASLKKWTAVDPSDYSSTYSSQKLALGYYPDGGTPTVNPDYKTAWTMIAGDSENSANQTVEDMGTELMKLTIYVAEADQVETVKRNFFEQPGLHRTMLGDGLATCLASLFGAPANTTYGENTGVLSLSRVYDPRVIRIAACLAILVSFCPKFSAFIGTIPAATIGGVSFILYGMISAVGVRNLVESQVDLGKSRNMLIAALILVLTLGISFSSAGAIKFSIGSLNISLSGLAVGALMGIVLNAILPGKDFTFSETAPSIKDADRFGGVKEN